MAFKSSDRDNSPQRRGREFQRFGTTAEKAWPPLAFSLVWGKVNKSCSQNLNALQGMYGYGRSKELAGVCPCVAFHVRICVLNDQ